MTDNTPELTLETVTAIDPADLTDDHKAFLEEHKADLTPEQATQYGITQEKKDEVIKPEDIEVETRTKTEEKPKEGEEDDEVTPEDEATIGKIVDKRLRDAGVAETKDQLEVDALIRVKPEYSKYRDVALKYMAHPAYKNIPAHNIMAIVASKDLQAIGAQKEREAARKAKETEDTGGSKRTTTGKIDWSNVSKEDFNKHKAQVMGQGV